MSVNKRLTPPSPLSPRELNRLDNAKGAKATDALLNYETVKYFANEDLERRNFADVSTPSCVCTLY